jgi:hypothetical protein
LSLSAGGEGLRPLPNPPVVIVRFAKLAKHPWKAWQNWLSGKKSMEFIKKIVLLMMVMIVFSGCSVLVNSEKFYGDRPQRPINWREYTTD